MAKELTEIAVEQMKEVFASADQTGTGKLTYPQFKGALESLGLPCEDPAQYDKNSNGSFTFNEFMVAADKIGQSFKLDHATLQKAFKMWDHAHQGYIKPAHLRHLLNDRGLPPGITEKDIADMIDHADQDGDGKIQWDEFVKFLIHDV